MGGTTRWSVGPFRRRSNATLQYDGERPSPRWHAHGYCACDLTFVEGVRLVRRRVHKRRWLDPATHTTTHSRPPDSLPYFRVTTVLVVIQLAAFMKVAVPEVEREDLRSRRTLQRWHRRAVQVGLLMQQALRHALIERCEPRPVEHVFKGGLSPPSFPTDFPVVTTLKRGLLMGFLGARGSTFRLPSIWPRLAGGGPDRRTAFRSDNAMPELAQHHGSNKRIGRARLQRIAANRARTCRACTHPSPESVM